MPTKQPQLFGKTRAVQTRTKRGKSLREILLEQGVPEKDIRKHMIFISECLKVNPRLDVMRYRANTSDLSQPMQG